MFVQQAPSAGARPHMRFFGLYLTARLQFAPDATLLSVAGDHFIEIPFQRLGCLIATAAVANHRLFDSKTTAITLGILPVQSGKIDGE
jgi:hypothetical protein